MDSINVNSWDKCLSFGFGLGISHSPLFIAFIPALFFGKICSSMELGFALCFEVPGGGKTWEHACAHMCAQTQTHTHTHARTHKRALRLPQAFTALLSCLMNPLAEHENTGKKEKPILLRWFDVICGLQNTRLYCVRREKEREQEKKKEVGLEIQNFN